MLKKVMYGLVVIGMSYFYIKDEDNEFKKII